MSSAVLGQRCRVYWAADEEYHYCTILDVRKKWTFIKLADQTEEVMERVEKVFDDNVRRSKLGCSKCCHSSFGCGRCEAHAGITMEHVQETGASIYVAKKAFFVKYDDGDLEWLEVDVANPVEEDGSEVKYSIDKSQRLDYMFYEKMGTYVLPGNLHKDFSRWMRGAVHYRWHKEKHVGVRRIAMTEEEARRKAKKAGGGVAKVQGAPKPARAKVPKAAEAPKPAAPKAKAAPPKRPKQAQCHAPRTPPKEGPGAPGPSGANRNQLPHAASSDTDSGATDIGDRDAVPEESQPSKRGGLAPSAKRKRHHQQPMRAANMRAHAGQAGPSQANNVAAPPSSSAPTFQPPPAPQASYDPKTWQRQVPLMLRPMKLGEPHGAGSNREHVAVLVIDMQEYTCNRSSPLACTFSDNAYFWDRLDRIVIPQTQALLSQARDSGVEVIYTVIECLTEDCRDNSRDYEISGLRVPRGSEGAKVIAALAPGKDEIVLSKTSCNVFVSTTIDWVLRCLGTRQLVVCGGLTDQCVESCVRDACDLGYLVSLAEDCCITHSKERHARTLETIGGYCRVATSKQLIQEMRGGRP